MRYTQFFLLAWAFIVQGRPEVKVFHYVINYWGDSFEGNMSCGTSFGCEWTSADQLKALKLKFENSSNDFDNNTITVGLFNIHSWYVVRFKV